MVIGSKATFAFLITRDCEACLMGAAKVQAGAGQALHSRSLVIPLLNRIKVLAPTTLHGLTRLLRRSAFSIPSFAVCRLWAAMHHARQRTITMWASIEQMSCLAGLLGLGAVPGAGGGLGLPARQ